MLYPVKGSITVNGATINLDLEVAPGLLTAALAELFGASTVLPAPLEPIPDQTPTNHPSAEPPSAEYSDRVATIMVQPKTIEEKIALALKVAAEEGFELFEPTIRHMLERFQTWTEPNIRHYFLCKKSFYAIRNELVIRPTDSNQSYDNKWIWQLAKVVAHGQLTVNEAVGQVIRRYAPQAEDQLSPAAPGLQTSSETEPTAPPALKPFVFEEATETANPKPEPTLTASPQPLSELEGLSTQDIEILTQAGIVTTQDLTNSSRKRIRAICKNYSRRITRIVQAAKQAGIIIPGQRVKGKINQPKKTKTSSRKIGRPRKAETEPSQSDQLIDDQEPITRLQADGLVPAFAKLEDRIIPEVTLPTSDSSIE